MKKIIKHALGASLIFCSISTAFAVPSFIYFDNQTDIKLNATIAGLPGKPIPANTLNYAVPYALVDLGCYQKQVMTNCPIEFFDAATGQKVATVNINANEAFVSQSPVIYGEYLNNFSVSGWDAKPISHIKINKKA